MNLFQSVIKKLLSISFICIVVLVSNTDASLLSEIDYKNVAKNYLAYMNSSKSILFVEKIMSNQKTIGRVFHLDGGYLIMPETQILPPIKGFSLKNNYHSLPKAYKDFIVAELQIYQSSTNNKSTHSDSTNRKRWDFLLSNVSRYHKGIYTPDTILLQTTWNQNYPYNKMLPKIGDTHVLAGCTQAAQAQIMKYHQHPKRGNGIASHIFNNQNLKTILFREYHWDNMPDSVDNSTPEHVQDEVALLFKDLAIVNKANFGINATSSSVNMDAMYEYFGYATDIKEITNENESEFFSVIRNEIDNQRPVLLSLPNHATVADGYASDDTGKKIHVNMGWGGHDDDYYYLNETIETSKYIYPVTSLSIQYNIKPCNSDENNCFENLSGLEPEDSKNAFQISGIFNSKDDIDTYMEYLKGDTDIIGDRGYSNQAFYISVYNSKGELVISSDEPIDDYYFSVGYYSIRLSLKGYEFSFDVEHEAYEVNISTQPITDFDIELIQRQDNPPIINNEFTDQIISLGTQYRVRVDAVDEDGDIVLLSAVSLSGIIDTHIEDDVLSITPTGSDGYARIFVIARSKGQQVQKSFDILVGDSNISWGKEFTIQGSFENQDDYHTHHLLLDSQCQITGDNGFRNQAFYTSILDNNQNTIIDMNDVPIDHNFDKSMYWIAASLNQSTSGKYYEYTPMHSGYTLFVNCPDASWTFQDIADIMGVDISNTSLLNLSNSILFLQVLSGYPDPDIENIMFIQNITKISMEDVLSMLRYVANN